MPNKRRVGRIHSFQPISHYILETLQDKPKSVLTTNRKSHMRFRLVPKSMTLDDLFTEFCSASHFWKATMAKQMKIDTYCQQQKCSPMTLVSGNIRCTVCGYSQGFPGARASNDNQVVDNGNFGRFGWLLLWKR